MFKGFRLEVLKEGKVLYVIDPSPYVSLKDKRLVVSVGSNYLRKKEGLVGLGAELFIPEFIGARNYRDVLSGVGWFEKEISSYKKLLKISSGIILERGLQTGSWSFLGATLLALPTLAFSMKSVDQTMKFSEMREHIIPHVKRLMKDRDELPKIIERISKWISEYAIARPFAYSCLKIIMCGGEGPDFLADGLGIEVTKPISSYDEKLDDLQSKIWSLVGDEFEQKRVDIVTLDISNTRLGPQWWGFTDPLSLNIQKSIREALNNAREGKRSFILYTFKPNTFDALGRSYLWGEKPFTFEAIT
jgi:hypothetical protein